MQDKQTDPGRRKFLSRIFWFLSGAAAVAATVPLASFFISPALRAGSGAWVPVGDASQLKDNEPVKLTYHFPRKDGWTTTEVRKTVFAKRGESDKIIVLSNKCTHLGCAVDWSSTDGKFTCPCHGGIFDADGNVVSGPPPRALAKMDAKIEDGILYVKEA